jgi:hypothetical protein
MARAGFLAIDCDDLVIRDLQFEGNSAEVDITVNVGVGVYLRNALRARLVNLRNWYGGSLLNQDNQSGDVGLRVTGCHSYGARGNLTCGSRVVIESSTFELPTDAGYHRSGNNGSSHAIYLFAGRREVLIRNCHFKNIRMTGVKGSGSANPLVGLQVQNCSFVDCGTGVLWGADDNQLHDGLLVEGNYFEDCGTNIAGWSGDTSSVVIYGSTGSVVRGNTLRYTRECLGTVSAVKGIQVQRYATGTLCKAAVVDGNLIVSDSALAPGNILTQAIYGNQVDGLTISNNQIRTVGGVAIQISNSCDRAILRNNVIRDCTTAISIASSVGVLSLDNILHRGPNTSSNPILIVDSSSKPTLIQKGNVDINSSGISSVLVN